MPNRDENGKWIPDDSEEIIALMRLEGKISNLERESKELNKELNSLDNKISELKGRILADDIEQYLREKDSGESEKF